MALLLPGILNYTFNEPGVYTVKLKASAGSASNEAIATIWVVKYIENLIIQKEHNCTVEIEYTLQNSRKIIQLCGAKAGL